MLVFVAGGSWMRTVRLFVSSPADTGIERKLVDRVAEQLNGEAAGFVRFETLRWENRVYGAHDTFQNLIPESAQCDVVVAIFRQRLGLPLPTSFRRMPAQAPYNGDPYPSGTGFEVLTALEAKAATGKPDVFVFRLSDKTPPTARLDKPEAYAEALQQWQSLEAFFARCFHTPQGEFTRAYNLFVDSDDFRRQVTVLLRDWMEENVLHQKAVVWPYKTKGSPFRSLQPFDAKHAAVYFGRDRKVGRALDEIASAARRPEKIPFLLIVGPSGAGKSSMMRAGVAPRLTTPGVVPEVDGWRIAIVRIGDLDPFAGLAAALLVWGEDDDEGEFGPALPELADHALGAPPALAAALESSGAATATTIVGILDELARAQAAREGSSREMRTDLLLLVDQFESIFVSNLPDERRSAFAALLQILCRTRRIWVVSTLRADLYHRFLARGAFIELADKGAQYNLAPPGDAELTEIIRKSAEAAGLVYELDAATGERLDDRILRDAQGENMLPLLQFALDRLFVQRVEVGDETRLTNTAYAAMGGLDGAIDQTADKVLQQFETARDHEAVQRLPRLLRSLAVPINADAGRARTCGALTVRNVPLAGIAGDPPTRRLVDALIEARILVTSVQASESGQGDPEAGLVGVAHQKVFESWKRAREIIEEHADFFVVRDDVERQVSAWAANRQDASYLLPSGPRLVAAEDLVERYAGELDNPLTREFVTVSGRLARRNQRRLRMFAAAMAVLAAVASAGLAAAMYFSSTAQRNYAVARDTIDGLMRDTTGQLGQLEGIRVETVEGALGVFSKAIQQLRAKTDGDTKLDRSEGEVFFNVAKLYQTTKSLEKAAKYASLSLEIRSRLTGYPGVPTPPSDVASDVAPWWWQLTESLEQMAFFERSMKKNLDTAAAKYTRTLSIRRLLVSRFAEQTDWPIGISRSLVGLGDIAQDRAVASRLRPERVQHLTQARAHYAEALKNTIDVFVSASLRTRGPPNPLLQREISWDLNKAGDVARLAEDYPTALADFTDGLCLRRMISKARPANTLWRRDVAFVLEKLGSAKVDTSDLEGARDAYLEALEIRSKLYDDDRGNAIYLDELGKTQHELGAFYLRTMEPTKAWAYYMQAAAARRDLAARSADNLALAESVKASAAAAERLIGQVRLVAEGAHQAPPDFATVIAADRTEFRGRLAAIRQQSADCWPKLQKKLGLSPPTVAATAP